MCRKTDRTPDIEPLSQLRQAPFFSKQRVMSCFKRLLFLCLMSVSVEALHSQPATPNPATPAAPRDNSLQPASGSVSNSATAMDANGERRAREMLDRLMSGPTPTTPPPGVAAAPPDQQDREAARQRALREAREASAAQPANVATQSPSLLDLQREKEISRIEAEVEAARKRREAAAGTTSAPTPASTPTAAPSLPPSGGVTPVTDTRGLATLQGQTANPNPAVQPPSSAVPPAARSVPSTAAVPPVAPPPAVRPVAPAVAASPAAVASPAGPTMTPEAEQKARELLRQNVVIVFSDNPQPQNVKPLPATLPPQGPTSVPAPAPVPTAAAQPVPPIAPPPAIRPQVSAPAPAIAATATAPGLNASDEQRARDLLRQFTGPPSTTPPAPAPVRNTGVIPPPAATLELTPAPGATVAPPAATEQPKPVAAPPPAAAVVPPVTAPVVPPAAPPVEVPRPVATPPVVTTAPSSTAPAPSTAAPTTESANPQDEATRALVRQAVANLRGEPSPSIPSTANAIATPPVVAPTVAPAAAIPTPTPPPINAAVAAPNLTPPTATAITPEQEAKARELLQQKSAEVARAPEVTPPPATTVTTAPAYTAPPVSPTPPPAVVGTASAAPAQSAGGLTPEAEAKARELVAQQVSDYRHNPTGQDANVQAAVQSGSPEEWKAKRELIKQQEREGKKRRAEEQRIEEMAKKQAGNMDAEALAKAREDARRKLEEEAKARTAPKAVAAQPAPVAPFKVSTTGSKRQRLDQLTDAYIHDKISPEEYHRERAKIVAEPGE